MKIWVDLKRLWCLFKNKLKANKYFFVYSEGQARQGPSGLGSEERELISKMPGT
jgi:hypothetical protein